MRKILAILLLACMIFGIANIVCATEVYDDLSTSDYLYTGEEILSYCEEYKDREGFPDYFVTPERVAFLGTMNRFLSLGLTGQGVFRYEYYIDFAWNEEYQSSLVLNIFDQGELDLSNTTVLNISKVDGSMAKVKDIVKMKPRERYAIKRGELYFVYYMNEFTQIEWEHNNMKFILYYNQSVGGADYWYNPWVRMEPGDNIISDLLSLEEEKFLKAQDLLLTIGNPDAMLDPEIPCGGYHIYAAQWDFDDNTHWYPCVCGAKSQQGFHGDENQDGACDICAYDPNGETVSDPVEDPVQPTQPPTEPATQPTEPTQPTTAAPTAPPTQPNPAEPDAPSVGLWIGISAAVLAAAAALLLLRKTK